MFFILMSLFIKNKNKNKNLHDLLFIVIIDSVCTGTNEIKGEKKPGWLRAVLLQHGLGSEAGDKSRRKYKAAFFELIRPGEKFLPDPHQLSQAHLTSHTCVSAFIICISQDRTNP